MTPYRRHFWPLLGGLLVSALYGWLHPVKPRPAARPGPTLTAAQRRAAGRWRREQRERAKRRLSGGE